MDMQLIAFVVGVFSAFFLGCSLTFLLCSRELRLNRKAKQSAMETLKDISKENEHLHDLIANLRSETSQVTRSRLSEFGSILWR